MTVAVWFLEEPFAYPLERVAAGFFLVAVALLMAGLGLFLREVGRAVRLIRVPPECIA